MNLLAKREEKERIKRKEKERAQLRDDMQRRMKPSTAGTATRRQTKTQLS